MSILGVEVRNLYKSFRKREGFLRSRHKETHALKDVSFEVALGETYGLLGPNGSGKSTLIRVLATLLVPDAGEVRLLGHRLPGEEREVRQKIGRVSVDAAFYKKLSARENLLYSAFLYGLERREAERRSMEILEALGLEQEKFTDPLEEMSRGMQQKVAITRALLVNPPLLLLDEPTTGLDPKSRRDVQTFLENLRREQGTTILLTSHDMAETERLCARIGFIAKGSLIAEGTAEELKRRSGTASLDDAFIALAGEKLEEDGGEGAPAKTKDKTSRGGADAGGEAESASAAAFDGEEVLQENR
ncbi:MAG TPA: ABC transporter ATP-binding protein [Pyrinomonadaceae bacterium]|nr:ABC transporter ATP-binding protein [Pyrinomonadaceae bacterium]